MEDIKNVINNSSKNIIYAAITYSRKWEIKNSNNFTTITFSFTQDIPKKYHYYKLKDDIPTSPFNKTQIYQAGIAMQSISDVANIKFVEVNTTRANIPMVNAHFYNPTHVAGYGYYPNKNNLSPVCINADIQEDITPSHLQYGNSVIVHEILHAIGLQHTHDTAGLTQQESIMSYSSEKHSGGNYAEYYVSMPQLYDIAALQYLYGPNMNTRTGNDTYTYSSDTPIFCIWDAGGIDTLDFSDQTQDQVINLTAGSFSDVGGLKANISIAFGVSIENAIGGSGDDKIIGNNTDNILTGGFGADEIWGGNGSNIFRYHKTTDSNTTSADTLHDFNSEKDKIDLSPIIYSNEDIALVDKFNFSGRTEIIRKYDNTNDITYLMIDFDNNLYETDMMIKLTGRHQLTLNNFIASTLLTA
ncbi:M10 family metallopeptidase [Yersinia enterocolitica]|uniref:M10 family metallopeptidase n=1 Tax=Yersinia enterocolitica TaxID=630 RepID=UPI001416FD3D|nr:M10 family metallopeptidase [Yersinia enterocolitica]